LAGKGCGLKIDLQEDRIEQLPRIGDEDRNAIAAVFGLGWQISRDPRGIGRCIS